MAQARPPLAYLGEINPPVPSEWDQMLPGYREAEEWKPDKGSYLRELARKTLIGRGVGEGQAADFAGLGGKGASTASADWAPLTGMAFALSDMVNPQTPGDTALASIGLLPGTRPVAKVADTAVDMLRAYHSSPHKFDKFEWSPRTARTGEGGAAYGEGLYLAENPAVSGRGGQYWKQFIERFSRGGGVEGQAADYLKRHGGDTKGAAAALDEEIAWYEYNAKHTSDPLIAAENQNFADRMKQSRDMLVSQHVGPHTYEVGIRARPEDLLDWDKPLSQQSAKVQAAVQPRLEQFPNPEQYIRQDPSGEWLYRAFQPQGGIDKADFTRSIQVQGSERLAEAGIPGHRFLDQGSRVVNPDALAIIDAHGEKGALDLARERFKQADLGSIGYWDKMVKEIEKAANPTRNYVIWQPEFLDILKRYGGVGAAPLAGLGAYGASRQEPAPPVY